MNPQHQNPLGIWASINDAHLLAAAGADFLEESVGPLLQPDQPDSVFASQLERVRTSPLPIRSLSIFIPRTLPCVGPNVDRARLLDYAECVFQRAARCGVSIIVFGSAGARTVPEGFPRHRAREQFLALLADFGPRAQQAGITIVVEPLNRGECNFINTLAEAADFVRIVAHPHIRLLADLYHMARENEPPEEILRHADLLRHVHIAERDRRTPPGVCGDDFRPYFRVLRQIGYNGPISCECNWTNLKEEAPRAIQTLATQLASC